MKKFVTMNFFETFSKSLFYTLEHMSKTKKSKFEKKNFKKFVTMNFFETFSKSLFYTLEHISKTKKSNSKKKF